VDFCATNNAKIPIIRHPYAVCGVKIALQSIFWDFMREAQQTARLRVVNVTGRLSRDGLPVMQRDIVSMKKTFFPFTFIFTFVFTFIFLVVSVGNLAAQASLPLEQAVQRAAENLETRLKSGVTVAVLGFASPTEEFSAYALDELTAALVNRRKVVVLERRNLDAVRQEQGFGFSGEADDESAIRIGHFLGAQVVVTGRLNRAGGAYRLVVQAINAETSAVETSYSVGIAADAHLPGCLKARRLNPRPRRRVNRDWRRFRRTNSAGRGPLH
jgi:TolB-like protein